MSNRLPYRVRYIPRLALSLGMLNEVAYHTSSAEDAMAFCDRVARELGGSHNGIISIIDTWESATPERCAGYAYKPCILNAG